MLFVKRVLYDKFERDYMAGTVMHLVIADRLLDILKIKNAALFYCGNLAPDAIMGRKDYQREMKNITHFKNGQKPYTFRIKENQEIYHKRLYEFVNTYLIKNADDYELYLGYIVHLLVDELYLLNYYEYFLRELEEKGISPEDEKFCNSYIGDVDRIDWELVRTYNFKYKMPDILRSLTDYEIKDYIKSAEIENSKAFIINKNFETIHKREPLEVTTYEMNNNFIELCVSKIPVMLKERFGELLEDR